MDYQPHSTDAMFARIIERLDNQDLVLAEIKEQTLKTNGRVTMLENEKWFQRGIVAAISVLATMVWDWMTGRR